MRKLLVLMAFLVLGAAAVLAIRTMSEEDG